MIFPWQPQSSFKGSLIGDGRDSVFILGLFLSFFFSPGVEMARLWTLECHRCHTFRPPLDESPGLLSVI